MSGLNLPSPSIPVEVVPGVPATPVAVEDPNVRGAALLRALERGFLYFDRLLARALPEPLNPFLQTGAIAVTSLIVATATGIALLLWYKPSLHMAYESVAAMSAAPWTAELMRSLHRYSSDACVFFALVHALRLFFERRFTGARWLAWVTGVVTVGVLWAVGWTGYWLVWDLRAQHVALGTARALDVLPIFADPMGRAFLVDESINSLLFFVVFFFHMLIPLALGVTLWLHLARISRPRFITRTPMTIWVLGSLLLLSIAYPAGSAEPARMTALPQAFTMDWWYLLPLALSDRLGGGALWSLLLASSVVTLGVPWYLARGRAQPASVTQERCNACRKCYSDCPYEAISMVPRTDGHERHSVRALVDPIRCVGCGICAGSCDTAGIGLDWFSVNEKRGGLVGWLKRAASRGEEEPYVAFVCAQSAGASLAIDPETGTCEELPGYLTLMVPCGGWVHPFGLEHTLRFGGKGAIVVTCGPGKCRYREGAEWERMRIEGEREPQLRTEKVRRDRVLMLSLDRTRKGELMRRARAFREGGSVPPESAPAPALTGLAAVLLAAVVAGVMGLISDLVYAAPRIQGSELVVTFKHPGQVSENCHELSDEEKAARPVHMRQDRICDRARASVRLRVTLDGAPLVESTHAPLGVWSDGNSIAIKRVPIEPGEHRVRVEIGDSADLEEWNYVTDQTLTFTEQARRVIAFDRLSGFTAH